MIHQATEQFRIAAVTPNSFADRLILWQRACGRHSLPWQGTRDPYAIWISEIMLQQTQVSTVIPYYERFVTVFPNVASLAAASLEEVLAMWSGLGYYSRGRNLHRTARILLEQYDGVFPQKALVLQQLPGIGRSTAAAIAAFAFGEYCAILDGNVKRILARYLGVNEYPGEKTAEKYLWELAESLLPVEKDHQTIASYTQALMDLGALVCVRTQPHCQRCPLQADCNAYQSNRTAVLPVPRPRKILPIRETMHLILLDQDRVLLKRRPATGIWGGLWCFPEIAVDQSGVDYCEKNLHMQALKFAELPHLQHMFTHFKLVIRPLLLSVMYQPAHKENSENNTLWLTIEEALQQAIPAPVRKLLLSTRSLLQSCTYE